MGSLILTGMVRLSLENSPRGRGRQNDTRRAGSKPNSGEKGPRLPSEKRGLSRTARKKGEGDETRSPRSNSKFVLKKLGSTTKIYKRGEVRPSLIAQKKGSLEEAVSGRKKQPSCWFSTERKERESGRAP